jgi:transcriptional regulator with XRE-family HTH domain
MRKTIYSQEHKWLVSQLKEAREQAGLSQKNAAQLLGVTQSFISKIEAGQYRIDVVQLKHFAQVYKKSLQFFLKGI